MSYVDKKKYYRQHSFKNNDKNFKYNAHGLSICEYVKDGKVELWLKVLFYIVHWYLNPKHKGKVFFQKYSTIKNVFSKWCFECTEDGIEEAFRRLKAPDLDLIKVEYNELKKTEFVENGGNPNHYIYRKVYINWKKLNKYMSIYTNSSKTLKELKNKSRLKKLVYKRFMSYTWNLSDIYKKAMEETSYEKYRNEKAMYLGWIVLHSSNYYKSRIINKKYLPEHAINLRKAQDKEALDEAIKLAEERLSRFDFNSSDSIGFGDNDLLKSEDSNYSNIPCHLLGETDEEYSIRCREAGWEIIDGGMRRIKDGYSK